MGSIIFRQPLTVVGGLFGWSVVSWLWRELFTGRLGLVWLVASFWPFVYRVFGKIRWNRVSWIGKNDPKEQNRMHRIYKFIQLFTDIPEVSSTVKRRKYLDPLLGVVKNIWEHVCLLIHSELLRGSEYSGLLFRLILVGGVLLFFYKNSGLRW